MTMVIIPRNAMYCMERRINNYEGSFLVREQGTQAGVFRKGIVEGKKVDDNLLDTDCSRTFVHQGLVPEEKIQEGSTVAI